MLGRKIVLITILMTVSVLSSAAFCATATTPIRLLYPSFAGSWATAWIAKEAGYFSGEGLEVDSRRR
jgi:ABC-type nitrate/sulfonate/bicarbonate transport system substrate-binding protein